MKTSRYNALKETPEGRERIKADNRRKWEQRKKRMALADGPTALQLRTPTPRASGPATVIAIDGEGITMPDGSYRYQLVCASTGAYHFDAQGINTEQILSLLLQWGAQPNSRLVGFCISYDVNMILHDLPSERLTELAEEHETYWQTARTRWHIMWYPGHTFTVSRTQTDWRTGQTTTAGAVTIWDVFGWFQTSLTTALEEWQIGTPAERARLLNAKTDPTFREQLLRAIRRDCQLQCRLLAELVTRAEAALVDLGIHVTRRDGAGAIAAALLQKNNVRQHMSDDKPGDIELGAYYGGRSQALIVGRVGPAYHFDINSAYPSVMGALPSLKGRWVFSWKFEPGWPWAVWKCRWAVGGERTNQAWPVTPFPWRDHDGSISYPSAGAGYYWSPLVVAARSIWGKAVDVDYGWCWLPEDKVARPLDWVEDWYQERLDRRKDKDPAHNLIKLGINALYGKMAQGVGYMGKKPPWQSFIWSGLVTAHIQAQLLLAARTNPRAIIAFNTDALWSREPLALPQSEQLGGWSAERVDELFILAPTIYATRDHGQEWDVHAAGYRPGEFPLQQLLDGWEQSRWCHSQPVTLRRFLGLQLARHLARMEDWGQWIDVPQVVSCSPGEGTPAAVPSVAGHRWSYWVSPGRTRREVSLPYTPKSSRVELDRDGGAALAMLLDQPEPVL